MGHPAMPGGGKGGHSSRLSRLTMIPAGRIALVQIFSGSVTVEDGSLVGPIPLSRRLKSRLLCGSSLNMGRRCAASDWMRLVDRQE
jgi:hypothetical protein